MCVRRIGIRFTRTLLNTRESISDELKANLRADDVLNSVALSAFKRMQC